MTVLRRTGEGVLMLDREEAKALFARYRSNRKGLRKKAGMGSVCLICGSSDVVVLDGDDHVRQCRSCGFNFLRYVCSQCGETVDSRDPETPKCRGCGHCRCVCLACESGCPQSA